MCVAISKRVEANNEREVSFRVEQSREEEQRAEAQKKKTKNETARQTKPTARQSQQM